MDITQNIICSYCYCTIKGVSYSHLLWKSYKMCFTCKNNLKSCFSCEKKIKKNIDTLVSCTCGSVNDNLCEECRKLSVVCCNKNISTIIAEILYFLDYYLDIKIPRDFALLQNIYTFNKTNFNEMNHCCTFEYNIIKNNKIDTSSHYLRVEKNKGNNKDYSQNQVREYYSNNSYPFNGLSTFNFKNKTVTDLSYSTKKKKNGILRGFFNELKILKKKEKRNSIYENETNLKQPNKDKVKYFTSLRSISSQKEKIPNKDGTKIISLKKENTLNFIKRGEGTDNYISISTYNSKKNEKKENIRSSRSLNISNKIVPLFDYIKKLKSINISRRKSYESDITICEKSKEVNCDNTNKYKTTMEKYNINFAMYFMNRYNENEMYTRLLNNELKYYDILYLNNIFKNNSNETTIASCGCVTISKEKLIQMHKQNKRLHNYKYKNINLEEIFMYTRNKVKLIDHISLTDSLPKISFFFFIAHELMHTYIWLSEPKKSKNFERIFQIVKGLHDNSFSINKKKNYECHKNLSFYLSPELEEAICIFVSIKLIQHMKKVLNNNSSNHIYEKKLINYYIQKYENSKSRMYGANYRLFKKIIRNYEIIDIMSIIHDIYLSSFYNIITLDLLKATISLINFIL